MMYMKLLTILSTTVLGAAHVLVPTTTVVSTEVDLDMLRFYQTFLPSPIYNRIIRRDILPESDFRDLLSTFVVIPGEGDSLLGESDDRTHHAPELIGLVTNFTSDNFISSAPCRLRCIAARLTNSLAVGNFETEFAKINVALYQLQQEITYKSAGRQTTGIQRWKRILKQVQLRTAAFFAGPRETASDKWRSFSPVTKFVLLALIEAVEASAARDAPRRLAGPGTAVGVNIGGVEVPDIVVESSVNLFCHCLAACFDRLSARLTPAATTTPAPPLTPPPTPDPRLAELPKYAALVNADIDLILTQVGVVDTATTAETFEPAVAELRSLVLEKYSAILTFALSTPTLATINFNDSKTRLIALNTSLSRSLTIADWATIKGEISQAVRGLRAELLGAAL